jgi:uncharacterized membrane protein YccC
VVPAVAIFVVTFAVRFLGCLGGYAIAAGTTLMLAFALAVMSTPVAHVDQRVSGWLLGCAVAAAASLVAAVPVRSIARDRMAAQCRALADHLRAVADGRPPAPLDVTPVRQVREELASSSARPLTATARQTALRALLDATGRATLICQRLSLDDIDPTAAGVGRLARTGADAFDAAARAVTDGTPVDLAPVHRALAAQRAEMVAALTDGPDARHHVADQATGIMRVRFATSLAAIAGAAAATWQGHRPGGDVQLDVEVDLPDGGIGPFWRRARRTLGFHLRWGSSRFRNSLRAAIALAASLTVARLVDFDHGFWVVLGTLMVLRSGVNDTTTTALQALRGTLVGFAVAVPIAYAANGHDALLWVLLPFTTFLAAWAPGAIGLGTGQAAFTIFVVVLFNLAAPAGTQTAVLRLETVATGIAVAVAAGFLFWPRGPEAGVGPIAGRLYRSAAGTIRAVSMETLGLPGGRDDLLRSRHQLLAAREQLDETMLELAADRRTTVGVADRVALTTPPSLVRAGDWARVDLALGTIEASDGAPSAPPAALEAEAFEVASRFDAVPNRLDEAHRLVEADEVDGADDLLLTRAATPTPPGADGLEPAEFLRLLWLWSWLTTVDESLRSTAAESIATIGGLPRRWWR